MRWFNLEPLMLSLEQVLALIEHARWDAPHSRWKAWVYRLEPHKAPFPAHPQLCWGSTQDLPSTCQWFAARGITIIPMFSVCHSPVWIPCSQPEGIQRLGRAWCENRGPHRDWVYYRQGDRLFKTKELYSCKPSPWFECHQLPVNN